VRKAYSIQFVLAVLACSFCTLAQTTQGLISGRLLDSQTGQPVAGASVVYSSTAAGDTGTAQSDSGGYYYLPLLSPASYTIRVSAPNYQSQQLDELVLPVAARLDLNFLLRPLSDVWETGQYRSVFLPGTKTIVTFYGPDVDTNRTGSFEAQRGRIAPLQSTVSQVVDAQQIVDLPLAGRDVYTMLVTQPGVTADSTTARSLGLSANGQRPSASSFLLDGIESNNYLVTGPLSPIPPEAIQEYRVSTNNFSAEYGGASGYLANAITASGTNGWHGLAYTDVMNDVLNANDFQSNRTGLRRTPLKQIESGFRIGGPIRRDVLFISANYDFFRSRSSLPPKNYRLPTPNLIAAAAPDSIARKLLSEFPPPPVSGPGLTAIAAFSTPVPIDRSIGLARADRLFSGGTHRLMARLAVTDTRRPDFALSSVSDTWFPYKDFVYGIDERTYSHAIALQSSLRRGIVNELRFGGVLHDVDLARPHADIPLLLSADGTALPGGNFIEAQFKHRVRSWQGLDNLTWMRGRHVVTGGGGFLDRNISGVLTAEENGLYQFATAADFAADRPSLFRTSLDRLALPNLVQPRFDREYRLREFFLFAQDTFKITPHLTLNFGLRYDFYGNPHNVGPVKDALVQLGTGASLAERLAMAQLRPDRGDEPVYAADRNNWGPRVGFSYNPRFMARTVVRGAYGVFYDRMFDNVWQNVRNNNFVLPGAFSTAGLTINYLSPVASVLPMFQGQPLVTRFADPVTQSARAPTTMFQPGLRTPYVQSHFFGIQQALTNQWTVEVNYLGSLGRKLITTDIVNRSNNAPIGPIWYRANQGGSSYNAVSVVARYRAGWAQFQTAYTLGHVIDNQSDALRGDYFNLNPTRVTASVASPVISAFTREFDSRGDRGSADFDQRHNLVFFSILDLPRWRARKLSYLFRDWKFSQLAAFRSGLPFTVFATAPSGSGILNQRADLVNPAVLYAGAGTPVAGGKRYLNPAAFAIPATGQVGNTGRNAFYGPGFYNIDISVGRSFPVPWLGESGRATFRADAFNFLNHANLNVPVASIANRNFGIAQYGRAASSSGLPVLSPVNDTSRQVQLIFRVSF